MRLPLTENNPIFPFDLFAIAAGFINEPGSIETEDKLSGKSQQQKCRRLGATDRCVNSAGTGTRMDVSIEGASVLIGLTVPEYQGIRE